METIHGNLADPRDHREGFPVYIGEKVLCPEASQRLRNHSPCGFSWGYGGSGCAQLALAVLLEVSGDPQFSLKHYHTFKEQVVSKLDSKFSLRIEWVKGWIEEIKQ